MGLFQQNLLNDFLKNTPYELYFCENGQEALDVFKTRNGFDMILMDMQMPIMDGYTSTQHIKTFEAEN